MPAAALVLHVVLEELRRDRVEALRRGGRERRLERVPAGVDVGPPLRGVARETRATALVGGAVLPPLAHHAGDVVHGARGDRLDALVGRGRAEGEAAAAADADRADPLAVDDVERAEVVDARREVLGEELRRRHVSGLAAGLPVVGGVEREGDEAAPSQFARVDARALLLDAAVRWADDQRRVGDAAVQVDGGVEVGGDLDAVAVAVANRPALDAVGEGEGVSVGVQHGVLLGAGVGGSVRDEVSKGCSGHGRRSSASASACWASSCARASSASRTASQ